MNSDSVIPVIVAILAAILGGLGGIAAILKVQSDNSSSVASGAKAVSEGAKTVIELMGERMDAAESHANLNTERIESLEIYAAHFDAWADRLIGILDRAITMLPDALRAQFESESSDLKINRPKRASQKSATVVTTTTVTTAPEK
jgi:hypothetical protein